MPEGLSAPALPEFGLQLLLQVIPFQKHSFLALVSQTRFLLLAMGNTAIDSHSTNTSNVYHLLRPVLVNWNKGSIYMSYSTNTYNGIQGRKGILLIGGKVRKASEGRPRELNLEK